jgi:hypothetical protein
MVYTARGIMPDPHPSVGSDAANLAKFGYQEAYLLATRGRHGLSMPDMHSIDAELEAEAIKDTAAGDVTKG